MYSIVTSSVTLPELATKYPLAQKWRPQNCLDMALNIDIIFHEFSLLPALSSHLLINGAELTQTNVRDLWIDDRLLSQHPSLFIFDGLAPLFFLPILKPRLDFYISLSILCDTLYHMHYVRSYDISAYR